MVRPWIQAPDEVPTSLVAIFGVQTGFNHRGTSLQPSPFPFAGRIHESGVGEMLSPHCSTLMPTMIYAKPRHSTERLSSLATRPVSPNNSTQPHERENIQTTTPTTPNLYDWSTFASVQPERSSKPNRNVLRSCSQQDQPVESGPGMTVMDAFELSLGREIEQTAKKHMLRPFQSHMELADAMQTLEDDDDVDTTASDLDDQPLSEGNILKTAAEVRADKRRMKRFRWASDFDRGRSNAWLINHGRLTHGQTRFLQSEFARQAHPDSAQRERLSKEIPGLSPRQVQVWFQNRYFSCVSCPSMFSRLNAIADEPR